MHTQSREEISSKAGRCPTVVKSADREVRAGTVSRRNEVLTHACRLLCRGLEGGQATSTGADVASCRNQRKAGNGDVYGKASWWLVMHACVELIHCSAHSGGEGDVPVHEKQLLPALYVDLHLQARSARLETARMPIALQPSAFHSAAESKLTVARQALVQSSTFDAWLCKGARVVLM